MQCPCMIMQHKRCDVTRRYLGVGQSFVGNFSAALASRAQVCKLTGMNLITDNAAFLRLILDNACPATKDDLGICLFVIETHCVLWYVEAVKGEDGEWTVLTMRSEPC